MNKQVNLLLKLVIFVLCLVFIVVGQKNIGYVGLGTMILGLSGLLYLLWDYNRKYQ
ncbi:DUF6903 family protein [Vagococcus fluvialis]|uniref:DUF6903 family protein n=1 Tax=Vagococcus fluvialis TaxID=2738 RepID=UPI003D0A970A